MDTSLLFVHYSAFVEEASLLSPMRNARRKIVRSGVQRYESSDCLEAIKEAQNMSLQRLGFEGNWVGNENDLVQSPKNMLKRALKRASELHG